MTIYLDDQPVQLEGTDLSAVLTAANDHLAPGGRILVEVQLDGQSLVSDHLEENLGMAVGQKELRLYSADPQELAVLTLQQVRQKLEDTGEAQTQAAQLLQEDRQDEAMRQVGRAIEGWQQTQQAALYSAQLLQMDLDDKRVDGQTITELVGQLIEQLRVLRDLLSSGDTVGLADVLAYEWPQTVDTWDQLIGQFIGWIERPDT